MPLPEKSVPLEEMLLKYVYGKTTPLLPAELKSLSSNVAGLSSLLTRERERLPLTYLKDEGTRKAYILYFLQANLCKIQTPLRELSLHPEKILSKERLKILDIGTGPGTAILGTMEFFSARENPPFLEFTGVDPVAENLRDAGALFRLFKEKVPLNASISTVKGPVEKAESFPVGAYDIIVLSNVLNEVSSLEEDRIDKRVSLLKKIIMGFLAPDGSCIIIEPSLRETSREMLEVRDCLLKEGLHIYSPCLMNEPCGTLVNPKDWCHEDISWEPPVVVSEVDRLIGLRKDSLKFSYLIIRKDGLSLADIYGDGSYRVVSDPLISKGKIEFYICGRGGRRLIVRLDKDEATANGSFSKLRRGSIIGLKGVRDEGKRLRIEKDTTVIFK